MCQQPQDLDHTIKRRLADLYRFPGFQTLASVSAHASRPHALVVHMRRLKKQGSAPAATQQHGTGMTTNKYRSGRLPARGLKSGLNTRNGA